MTRNSDSVEREITVWRWPVRFFHWALVALVIFNFVAIKLGGPAKLLGKLGYTGFITDTDLHMVSGRIILTLLLFRIAYGLIGDTAARFAHFVAHPQKAWAYLRSGGEGLYAGHTPAGGWMVVAMLLVLTVMAIVGLFGNDDIMAEGPLMKMVSKATSDTLTYYHRILSRILIGLVVLHVGAILYYRFVKKDNLIPPMIHGRKSWPAEADRPELRPAHPLTAPILLGISAALVWWTTG